MKTLLTPRLILGLFFLILAESSNSLQVKRPISTGGVVSEEMVKQVSNAAAQGKHNRLKTSEPMRPAYPY